MFNSSLAQHGYRAVVRQRRGSAFEFLPSGRVALGSGANPGLYRRHDDFSFRASMSSKSSKESESLAWLARLWSWLGCAAVRLEIASNPPVPEPNAS